MILLRNVCKILLSAHNLYHFNSSLNLLLIIEDFETLLVILSTVNYNIRATRDVECDRKEILDCAQPKVPRCIFLFVKGLTV